MEYSTIVTKVVTHKITVTTEHISFLDLVKLLIPVILFFAGLAFNRILEMIKEQKRLNDLKEYFSAICKQLDIAVNHQVGTLIKTAKLLKQFKGKDFLIPIIPGFNLDEFSVISKTDLYKIFVGGRTGNISDNALLFHKLLNCIHFYESVIKMMSKTDEETLKIVSGFRENWNKNQSAAMNEINTMTLKAKIDGISPGQDPFLDSIQKLIKVRKAKLISPLIEDTVDNMYDEYLQPMISILTIAENERAMVLLPYFSSLNNEYTNLQKFRLSKSSYLASLARNLQHARMDLREILYLYKSLKKKY